MNSDHWREVVEIFGVVSIVTALLFLAWQLQQSNRIASAELRIHLSNSYNEIDLSRAADPEIAKLYAKLEAPESHLITATDRSQIRGLASHYMTGFWNAQTAYEKGLIDRHELDEIIGDIVMLMTSLPGIRDHFASIYDSLPAYHGRDIFSPIEEYIASQPTTEDE